MNGTPEINTDLSSAIRVSSWKLTGLAEQLGRKSAEHLGYQESFPAAHLGIPTALIKITTRPNKVFSSQTRSAAIRLWIITG